MSKRKQVFLHAAIAALLILGAAICAGAQNNSNTATKQNTREPVAKEKEAAPPMKAAPGEDLHYSYEFTKSDFFIRHIVIKHDATGHGEISFERQGDLEPIVEPLQLSESASSRIKGLWEVLRFLDSNASYQAEKQFPHLGTMKLWMRQGTRERAAEFNWTQDQNMRALVDEYRRAANQSIFVFDISVARQNQPLDSPKILSRLDTYLKRNEISDPRQLIPLLRDLNTDERLPLMARNHAGRILKMLEKENQ
ncbi:MAG TPA: hypothetical protein VJT09_08760 [Pyrinomonadaceae bacterium]|nr:hypothetical protein [Pyrinomonadaceae bacterium]